MQIEKSFEHKISKGSRFNQIYIPRCMEGVFEAGDMVEVRLIGKKEKVHYSDNLSRSRVGEFKESIIRSIFSNLENFKGIKQAFVVGSFLTQKTDYNDIDVLLITDSKHMEEKAYARLSKKIQLKFHTIAVPESKFDKLIRICPMTRSMMHYFASNKKFEIPGEDEIDKQHIEFLLMMPEDLLKLKISGGRMYFDALRRLIAIRKFIEKKPLDQIEVDSELKSLLGEAVYGLLKKNESFDDKILEDISRIMGKEIAKIRKML